MARKFKTEEATLRYLADKQNVISFVTELHEYLKKHMQYSSGFNGKKRWYCGYDRMDPHYALDCMKNFILFCKKKHLNWNAVHDYFSDEEDGPWCMCDCDYLYCLSIDENGSAVYIID